MVDRLSILVSTVVNSRAPLSTSLFMHNLYTV